MTEHDRRQRASSTTTDRHMPENFGFFFTSTGRSPGCAGGGNGPLSQTWSKDIVY